MTHEILMMHYGHPDRLLYKEFTLNCEATQTLLVPK